MRICKCITTLQVASLFAVGLLALVCGNAPRNSPEKAETGLEPSPAFKKYVVDGDDLFGGPKLHSRIVASTEMISFPDHLEPGNRFNGKMKIITRCGSGKGWSYCVEGLRDGRTGRRLIRARPRSDDYQTFREMERDYRYWEKLDRAGRAKRATYLPAEYTIYRALRVTHVSPKYVSIYLGRDEYTTGAAHHNHGLDCATFDRRTGARIAWTAAPGGELTRRLKRYIAYAEYEETAMYREKQAEKFPAFIKSMRPRAYFVIEPLIPRPGLKSKYSFRVLDAEARNIVLCDQYAYGGNLTEYRVKLNALPPVNSLK